MQYSKITIITVCYNAAKDIERTMQSVFQQQYNNIEYIIIDGASTDGTQAIIEKYKDRLSYYVSEKDDGIYDAMNKGLKHASGQWVNFMNAGDVFADKDVLKDIFCTSILSRIMVIGGNTIRDYKDHTEMEYASNVDSIKQIIPFSHQSTFVRLSDDFHWQFNVKYRIAADYNLLLSIYKEYGRNAFLITDRIIARYDMTDSFTFNHFLNAKKEYLRIQNAFLHLWWWKEWSRIIRGIYK